MNVEPTKYFVSPPLDQIGSTRSRRALRIRRAEIDRKLTEFFKVRGPDVGTYAFDDVYGSVDGLIIEGMEIDRILGGQDAVHR